jgi:hypothetical protein
MTLQDLIASGVTHAYTLHPEWAHGVRDLDKRIENRSRMFPRDMLGRRFAIHAGAYTGGRKTRSSRARGIAALLAAAERAGWSIVERFTVGSLVAGMQPAWVELVKGDQLVKLTSLATSAIVATAIVRRVLDKTPTPTETWHVAGEYGYVLEEVEVLEVPIPAAPGALGLWSLARCREAA